MNRIWNQKAWFIINFKKEIDVVIQIKFPRKIFRNGNQVLFRQSLFFLDPRFCAFFSNSFYFRSLFSLKYPEYTSLLLS